GDVVRTVIVSEDALGPRIVVDAIRPLPHIDFLNKLEVRGIEHRDFVLAPIAGESVFEFGCNRDPMHARRVCDGTHQLSAIGVQNVDLSRVRNVDPPRRTVYGYVIKTSDSGHRITAHYLVISRTLQQDRGRKRQYQNALRLQHFLLLSRLLYYLFWVRAAAKLERV